MAARLWKQDFNVEVLNQTGTNTMVDACGIVFTDFGDNWLKATMPVNEKTVQPMRILHGGANVVLAETMGSVASILCLDDMNKQAVVGVEINANHLKSVAEGGTVTGTVSPVRIGRKLHVWQIEIHNEAGDLICTSRLTAMVIER